MSDLEWADPQRLDVFSEAEQPTSCIELGCLQVAGDRSTSAADGGCKEGASNLTGDVLL